MPFDDNYINTRCQLDFPGNSFPQQTTTNAIKEIKTLRLPAFLAESCHLLISRRTLFQETCTQIKECRHPAILPQREWVAIYYALRTRWLSNIVILYVNFHCVVKENLCLSHAQFKIEVGICEEN